MTRIESGSLKRRRPRSLSPDQSAAVVASPSKIYVNCEFEIRVKFADQQEWYNFADLNPRGFFEYYLSTPSPSISLGNRCPPPLLTPTVKGEFDQYFPSDIIRAEQLLEEGAALQSVLWRRMESGERLTDSERERILNTPCFATMLKQHKRRMAEEICELREPQTTLPSSCRPPIAPEARQPCVPNVADVPRMPIRSPLPSNSSLHPLKPRQSPVEFQKPPTDPQQIENLRSYTGTRARFHQMPAEWPCYHTSYVNGVDLIGQQFRMKNGNYAIMPQKERERRKRQHVEATRKEGRRETKPELSYMPLRPVTHPMQKPMQNLENGMRPKGTEKRTDESLGSVLSQAFRTLDDDHGGYSMPVTVDMRRRVES
ncbi:hypothetical protein PRIPAC_70151 [Pristionchus pacificus]|uniref:Uncharacterized protein n=1 Tax=Pristionchus pacificus TaxID=54126 RepID=A0A454XJH4_PRIPA|nr:hypothetical protein PRIPAC_70151 [Pristionchus pacificus]|eukprot:PDM80951.1 hypothetical protein PRIPAC_35954 [Pristionchus pacificus]